MRCDRCGRENLDQLTFCEDCGFSLKRPGPRPAAPPFAVPAPPVQAAAPELPGVAMGASCGACQTRNQAGFRFCVTCGAPLGGPQPRPQERPTTPDGAAALAVAVAMQQAQARPAPLSSPSSGNACPRCRAAWDGLSRCAVCGFAVTEARSLSGTLIMEGQESRALPTDPQPSPFSAFGRLVMVGQDGRDGEQWPLSLEEVDIGGQEGQVVIPNDPFLSPRHARLTREHGPSGPTWWVTDLASVNGVYRRLRGPLHLRNGDLILLGQQVLRFEAVNDAEQALRPVQQHGTAIFGTPALPCWARLCQRSVEGITRDVFHLRHEETTLGREMADIVFTHDAFLSRHHAKVRRASDGAAVIEDLGSSNGTFVALTKKEPLSNGDILRMGLHMFRVEIGAEGAR